MNLTEFMESTSRNQYIQEPGWDTFYIRKGPWIVEGKRYEKTIQLANIEAAVLGKGTFKNLVKRLQTEYPDHLIYVECVFSDRFMKGLRRMGFFPTIGDSFYLEPTT